MGQEYSSLNIEERTQLGLLVSQKLSQREIAAQMGRSTSTISRELARNGGSSLFRVEHDISFGGDRCERVLGQMGKL
jgi:IS30 family transposase